MTDEAKHICLATEIEQAKFEREQLFALLHGVTAQRDEVLSQYEAMAIQLDESSREIRYTMLDAQHNAKRAEDSERRVGREVVHANELSRQLAEERRKRAEIAAEFSPLSRCDEVCAH